MRALLFVTCLLSLPGCDADAWLFPLWVPTDVLVADVDGDGRADVVTLARLSTSMSHSEGRLVVYRQTTPGIFAPPESYVVGVYPWKLGIGDVDGDGLPDLLATDVDSPAVAAAAKPARPGTLSRSSLHRERPGQAS